MPAPSQSYENSYEGAAAPAPKAGRRRRRPLDDAENTQAGDFADSGRTAERKRQEARDAEKRQESQQAAEREQQQAREAERMRQEAEQAAERKRQEAEREAERQRQEELKAERARAAEASRKRAEEEEKRLEEEAAKKKADLWRSNDNVNPTRNINRIQPGDPLSDLMADGNAGQKVGRGGRRGRNRNPDGTGEGAGGGAGVGRPNYDDRIESNSPIMQTDEISDMKSLDPAPRNPAPRREPAPKKIQSLDDSGGCMDIPELGGGAKESSDTRLKCGKCDGNHHADACPYYPSEPVEGKQPKHIQPKSSIVTDEPDYRSRGSGKEQALRSFTSEPSPARQPKNSQPSSNIFDDGEEVAMHEGVGVGFKDNAADKMLKSSAVDLAALLDDDGCWSDEEEDEDYSAPARGKAKDEVEEDPALAICKEDEPLKTIPDLPASEVEDEEIEGGKLAVGTTIEANFASEGQYFPGEIVKVNADGTYGILYDDGDRESKVRRDLIKVAEKPKRAPPPAVKPGFKAPPVQQVADDYDLDFEDDLDEEFM
jgi:hypothetical protein